MITVPVVGAVVLLVGIGIAHSYLGERYILIRLFRRPDLPQLFGNDVFTRRTLRFAWHTTTVAWFGFAAVLALAHRAAATGVLYAVAATFLVSAAVTVIGSRGRHLAWPGTVRDVRCMMINLDPDTAAQDAWVPKTVDAVSLGLDARR